MTGVESLRNLPPSRSHGLRSTAGREPVPWRLARLPATLDLVAAQTYCREVAARHYENFTVATSLVPSRLRQHLANVYAFARWSDDLADEAGASPDAAGAPAGGCCVPETKVSAKIPVKIPVRGASSGKCC